MTARLYRLLLTVAVPRDLRVRHGEDMVQVFRAIHRDARRRGFRAVLGVWWRAISQTLGGGIADRLRTPGEPERRPPPKRRASRLDHLRQDLRFAVRSFLRKPGFALTAIGIAALGIGATTAIFSVVDTVVLRRLPYPEADRLVFFQGGHTVPDYRDFVEQLGAFESIAAVRPRQLTLLGEGAPQQLDVGEATPNFLPMFGASPALGRLVTAEDVATGTPAAVLAHDFWLRHFGGDESVLGRTIQLDDTAYEIVGVTAPGFRLVQRMSTSNVAVWTGLDVSRADFQRRNIFMLRVAGRLADGATLEMARSQITTWEEAVAQEYPMYVRPDGSIRRVPLLPLHDAETGEARNPLFMLLGAVGLMLLIACANVANLLLARGADRERELAVRAALGGSRERIVGQLLTESSLLAVTGAVLGIGLAHIGVNAFTALAPADVPRLQDVSVDLRVLAFAFAASLATGLLFGLLPAWYGARADVSEALREGGGKASAGRGHRRVKDGLVVGEIAVALILLVGAGLLFNSFVRLRRVDPGFDPENVTAVPLTFAPFSANPENDDGTTRLQLLRDIVDRTQALPGVEGVAASLVVPFTSSTSCCGRGTAMTESELDTVRTVVHPVTPGFFRTLRIPMIAGRDLDWRDAGAAENPVVITQTLADRFFGDANPVGASFRGGVRRTGSYTVVGVVGEPRFWSLAQDSDLDVFVPYDSETLGFLPFSHLAVRTAGPVDGLADALRGAVWELDPDMPIPEVMSLPVQIDQSMTSERFLSTLLLVFAGVAIVLAAAGIYGTMLYTVGQQSHEFGIRMALGADGARILRQVLRRGLALTAVGAGMGLVGAVALSRVLTSLVFGITVQDVPTYGMVTVLLGVVSLVACYIPARTAAGLDPIKTLRKE